MALEGGLHMPEQARRGRTGQARRRRGRGRRAGAPDRFARPDRKVSLPVHGGGSAALLSPNPPTHPETEATGKRGGEQPWVERPAGLEPWLKRASGIDPELHARWGKTKRVQRESASPATEPR